MIKLKFPPPFDKVDYKSEDEKSLVIYTVISNCTEVQNEGNQTSSIVSSLMNKPRNEFNKTNEKRNCNNDNCSNKRTRNRSSSRVNNGGSLSKKTTQTRAQRQ